MLSSCLANAAPDAGQALRDVESRRLNLPAPVELDAERPSPEDGVSRAAEKGGPTVLVKRLTTTFALTLNDTGRISTR